MKHSMTNVTVSVSATVEARRMHARAAIHPMAGAFSAGATTMEQDGLTNSSSRCRRGVKENGKL